MPASRRCAASSARSPIRWRWPRQVYPGKRNSLDALCDRFGVDRSNRTFHGAKLDAQLLADVYINLTRGQDALLIDVAPDEPTKGAVVLVDLRSFELPVLMASEQKLAAHEEVLAQLDKASSGHTLFRQIGRARCGIIAGFACHTARKTIASRARTHRVEGRLAQG